jgi:FMN-dependent oxidoreductase (nitrilotriacetate monooxygenase family)
MKLSSFAAGTGNYHVAGWRHPQSYTDTTTNFDRWIAHARKLEHAKFDMLFIADSIGPSFFHEPPEIFARSPLADRFEPVTWLAGLATVTQHIGLAATVTTSYTQPYDVARQMASLDMMSRGRAGWNIVTGADAHDAAQYGDTAYERIADRYARGEEFVDVVLALWNSVQPDAFPRNKASGLYADPGRIHAINHKGRYYSVKGPLSIGPSPQGRPVLVQAGQSAEGRALTSRVAEVVFTAWGTFDLAKKYYDDIKGRAAALNRNPDGIKILPGVRITVGRSEAEAHEKEDYINSLIDLVPSMARLNMSLADGSRGIDVSRFPLDEPFPEMPPGAVLKGRAANLIEMARREKLTLRQVLIRSSNSNLHFTVKGTAAQIVDQMEHWFKNGACDGFNILGGYMPGTIDDIIALVLPELRRRGLFRTAYEGRTLRENLGIPLDPIPARAGPEPEAGALAGAP